VNRLAPVIAILLSVATALVLSSCQGMKYDALEKLGWHKRDLLVSRVESARDEQEEAKEQFQTALERFTEVVGFEGGDLQSGYNKLQKELDRCEDRAEDVRDRIDSIEDVSEALFVEWEQELAQFTSEDLRRRSEEQLEQTRGRYGQLIRTMQRAEQKMQPVLGAFRDHVLFLKHNLNAQAVASLQGEALSLESDISDLIREMEIAIAEADSFIESMGQG
jgi:ElaB/YqjD/DUF883 family membrane-anchored ribosome-binding protein